MDNEIQEFNSARRANVQAYKSTTLKVRKIVAHITFNKTCINNSLTPKYAQIKIKHNNQAARITQHIAQRTYIKESIKQLYKKKDALNRKALTLHLHIANTYGHNYMTELILHTNEWIKKQIRNIQTKHDRKIGNLTPIKTDIIPSVSYTHLITYLLITIFLLMKSSHFLCLCGIHFSY